MATEIAKQLIYNLRNDALTREHFSMENWNGKGTCGSVGCVAGTALVMAGAWKPNKVTGFLNMGDYTGGGLVGRGAEILGIDHYETASHLFMPADLTEQERWDEGLVFKYLPDNAMPARETVEAMKRFCVVDYSAEQHLLRIENGTRLWFRKITPDHAAHALEQVTVDEIPYVNWARAFDEVPA